MRTYSFTPFPVLSTERFILRQLSINDTNKIFLPRSDSEVNKYLDRPIANSIVMHENSLGK